MEKSLYRYILKHSMKQQVILLVVTVASFPFLYFSYELPKLIINHIKDVGEFVTDKPLNAYPESIVTYFEFGPVAYLLVLCFGYLGLVLIAGGFKYFINVFKGLLGERMLRRLRFELYGRVLRFPLPHFKKISQGEIIPMITQEVEPLGGFIGDAYVQPLFQGGLLLVPLVFILVQDPILGMTAIALYPMQIYIIPKLQRRVNLLGKERVRVVRKLADRIGESVAGAQEVHANDAANLLRADFSDRLGTIFGIRYRIYRLKFFTKYLNNTLDKLTPFFFYSIGGYLVFQGNLDLGALVAVIAAQKDLSGPWKELLNYYQHKEDARIKYEQVIEQFEPPDMMDATIQDEAPEKVEPLSGKIEVRNVGLSEDGKVQIVDNVSFDMSLDEQLAVVGGGGSGKEEIGMMLARLLKPTSGSIAIDGTNLADLPEAVTGQRIGYVGSAAYLFSDTVGSNLYLGLKHRPLRDDFGDDRRSERKDWLDEAKRAGNLAMDIQADWIDYQAAGANDHEGLTQQALEALRLADMEEDMYQIGLRGTVDGAADPTLEESILLARAKMRERLQDEAFAKLVEPFDKERYNTNATMAENLLFGTPVGDAFDMERIADNAYVQTVLDKVALTEDILAMGRELADTMVELFADLPPGHEFFEQYSFISSEDLPEFQALLGRIGKDGLNDLRADDRSRLLSLPFKLIPARHRLGLIDENLQNRLLEARRVFAEDLPDELAAAVEFFDETRFNTASSLQDNVLFGKIAYGEAGAAEKVSVVIHEVLDSLDLRPAVMRVAFDHQVGIGGSRLSSAQRQKLAIARTILKRPDLVIINEALNALDGAAQNRVVANLREELNGRGFICILNRPTLARQFERILVMQAGRLVEQGSFDELNRDGTALRELVAGD